MQSNERVKLYEARVKNLEDSCTKMNDIITMQHGLISQHDRSARMKRLIFGGIPEDEWKLHGQTVSTDREKVDLVLKHLNKSEIKPTFVKRVGNPDQGPQRRPRYLLVELNNQTERNDVKNMSTHLNENEETKIVRIKADLSKQEREEYSRFFKEKERIESEDSNATVEINKGKLIVNGRVVDQLKFNSSLF